MKTLRTIPISLLVVIVLLCSGNAGLKAQITISGTGEVLDNGEKTPFQLRETARQEAINNALYDAFGSMVFSEYERLISTEMSGRSVISNSDNRIQYAKNYPNGIWLKNIDVAYSTYEENGRLWMKCTITGLAKEMDAPKIQFEVKTLDGTDSKLNETQEFINGEKGYMYFKAAEDGYLMIFLDDFLTVQRCLPYNKMTENCYPVKAHTDYVFFTSKLPDGAISKQPVDELELYTNQGFEYNQFYVFFSPEPFSPPILNQESALPRGYSTLKSVKREAFHSWLQDQRLKNKELQIKTIGVTIRKTN